jgi:hypothetical protein
MHTYSFIVNISLNRKSKKEDVVTLLQLEKSNEIS